MAIKFLNTVQVDTDVLYVDASSDKVGIGTTNPSEKLTVRNGTSNTDVKILAYNSAAGTEATLKFSTIASETSYEKAAIIARNAAGSFGRSDMHFALDSAADIGNVQFSDTKMTILNGGNVGIGTTDPQAKLHVANGTLRTWTPTSGTSAIFESTVSNRNFLTLTATNEAELWFGDATTQAKGRIRYEIRNSLVNLERMEFWTNSTEQMVINFQGDVGIGTADPNEKLHVSGSGGVRLEVEATDSTVVALKLTNTARSYASFVNVNGSLSVYDYNASDTRTTLLANGYFGIGTTNPGSKLEVDGEIDASGGDGYRINGKPWAEESSGILRLGDWDGEGFTTSIFDDNSAEIVRIGNYGTMIKCYALTSTYGANASLAVGTAGATSSGAAVVTLSNSDTTGSAGDATGIIQFAIQDDAGGLGYTSASIKGSISQAPGSGNGGGGILDFLTAPSITGNSPQIRMRIKDSGNVGIGTTNPGSILHLEDTTPTLKILSNQFYNNSVISMGNGQSEAVSITCSNNPGLSNLELKYDNGAFGDARIRVGQRNLDFMIDGGSAVYINSSKNVGIGTTSIGSGFKLDVSGEIHSSTYVSATAGLGVDNTSGQLGRGISLYGGPTLYPQYGLLFAQTVNLGTYGGVSADWATYMTMNPTSGRGWIWKAGTINSTGGNVASINTSGQLTLASTATATNFILSSDETLKDNIKEIDTKHVDVDWKNFELKSEPGIKRAGVIAQELEIKHPEFVRTADDGLKSVAYIDLLITKIAELEARLEKLEK